MDFSHSIASLSLLFVAALPCANAIFHVALEAMLNWFSNILAGLCKQITRGSSLATEGS